MTRAGMVLIQDKQVALIERHRVDQHYFVFPGGRVEEGETLPQTVVREAQEELGLQVKVEQLIAIIHFQQIRQYYYRVSIIDGEFGCGRGAEMIGLYPVDHGTYQAVWLPVKDLFMYDIRPQPLLPVLELCARGYWPVNPLEIEEQS